MNSFAKLLSAGLFLLAYTGICAVRYVDSNSLTPVAPYTSWLTAAVTIQAAVDVSAAGDEIVVTNGTYAIGSRVSGALINRVAVDKPVFVHSLNGPQFTIIQGNQVAGSTNGSGAIRCAYLTNGAALSGFTLTKGATLLGQDGGGVWSESSAVVSNCIFIGNAADSQGGGAHGGTLNNCVFSLNWAGYYSGGAVLATLNDCIITTNSAGYSAGANGALNRCVLLGNSAQNQGGAASWSTLNNCVAIGNSAPLGGATYAATVNNCTLTGNSATTGGGAYWSILRNSIAYFNTAGTGSNYDNSSTLDYCCTTPLPAAGVGNIDSDPLFVSLAGADLHLQSSSPCMDAGDNSAAAGLTDLDNNPRIIGPKADLGAYEYQNAGIAPFIAAQPASQSAVVGDNVTLRVTAIGTQPLHYQWSFNNSPLDAATNATLTFATVQLSNSGSYFVTITNSSGSVPSSTVMIIVYPSAPNLAHYVNASNVNPSFPYTNWQTAAPTIQDGVDAALTGEEVIVTNGVYATGGRAVSGLMTNRVAVDKVVRVRSVNGPQFTIIQGGSAPGGGGGDGAIRCVYLTNAATLSGFTLTNGATRGIGADELLEQSGAGVWCAAPNSVVSNCIIIGNTTSTFGSGGGAEGGTLYNCILSANSGYHGGGADAATLSNCTLTANSGSVGGGAHMCTVINCKLTGNFVWDRGGGAFGGTLHNCLLTGNSATNAGGGAFFNAFGFGSLKNCTISANSAPSGGGVSFNTNALIVNSVIYFNTGISGSNYSGVQSYISYSCTAPVSLANGNIAADSLFVSLAEGNFHLQSNSPCINAGNNGAVLYPTDLDNHPRIFAATVDMGAYEFYPEPALKIVRITTNVSLSWPLWASNFVVQQAEALALAAGVWSNLSAPVMVTNDENVVAVPLNSAARFFRLILP